MGTEIRFYRPGDRNGFLSSFFECTFSLDGRDWRTVEHYYQAQKFAGTLVEDEIRRLKWQGGARAFAHARRAQRRPDWEQVRCEVRNALLAKFRASAFLAEELLATQDAVLVEDSPDDLFWGIGSDGTEKNMLGRLLLETRQIIFSEGDDRESEMPVFAP